MSDWKKILAEEWDRREGERAEEKFFPLIFQGFDSTEIVAAVESILDGRLTMGEEVQRFERNFADYIGVEHAVMVNSGSSANLLAVAVAANPLRSRRLSPGDEVLVPAVAWSTSVWPLVQHQLTPVFVDVDPKTLNMDPEDLQRKITSQTRGIMAVHVLGNASPIDQMLDAAQKHDLILIEDTCESLGSRFRGRPLGGYGDFGCYSFYYSHHLTTGEGGMVVCHSQEDYDLLQCLRAHGWSRSLSNRAELEKKYAEVDARFMFVNTGYNLRPLEIQAAIGNCQIKKLDAMNATRDRNRGNLIAALEGHPRWKGQFSFPESSPDTEPAWFGFVCMLHSDYERQYKEYLGYLSSKGIENRPIISGNFTRQPGLKLLDIACQPKDFPGAEEIHNRGFFMGIQTRPLSQEIVDKVADFMLEFDFAQNGEPSCDFEPNSAVRSAL